MKDSFTAGQVAELAGVPYSTLDYWSRSKFLPPSISPATGKGSDRIYNFQDIVAARVALQLRQVGVSLQALRRVVEYLRSAQRWEQPLAEVRLVVTVDHVLMVHGEYELVSALKQPGQAAMAFVLDLSYMVEELFDRVSQLEAA